MPSPAPIVIQVEPLDPQYQSLCPLRATDVSVRVSGLIATYTIKQRYVSFAQAPIEVVVRVPLPDHAVVLSLQVKQGSRTIEAVVREKEQAQRVYQSAKEKGQRAALAEEVRENLLLLQVTQLLPEQPLEVELQLASYLDFEAGEASFVLPTTMTPRYSPAGTNAEDSRRVSPPFHQGERLYGLSFALEIDAKVPLLSVGSASHLVLIERLSETTAKVMLREKEVIPDSDIIVSWQMATTLEQPMLETARRKEGEAAAFMIAIPPPPEANDEQIVPRQVIFLLDRSGSMEGAPIDNAKRALRGFLRALGPHDDFGIIAFDDALLSFDPVPFSDETLGQADAFIEQVFANGGTEVLPALQAALAYPLAPGFIRTVVLLTDGSVSNEDEIARAVQFAANTKNLRAHAIGLGESVNRALVQKVARAGRGIAEFVPNVSELEPALARFQARSGAPLATDVSIDFEGGAIVDVTPTILGDVDLGQPLVVFARALSPGETTLILRARLAKQVSLEKRFTIQIPEGVHGNIALPSLWARSFIDEILWAKPADERDKVLQIALLYQLVTPYTSMIAVDRQDLGTGQDPESVEVPLHMPRGLSMDERPEESAVDDLAMMPSPMLELQDSDVALWDETQSGAEHLDGDAPIKFSKSASREWKAAPSSDDYEDAATGDFGEEELEIEIKAVPESFESAVTREFASAAEILADEEPWEAPVKIASHPTKEDEKTEEPRPTNEALQAALRFLARSQSATGAFGDAATTALIVAAFSAAGETSKKGLYRRQLSRAESFLQQNPSAPLALGTSSLEELLAAQNIGGNNDGAVEGLGDVLQMTASLVLALCIKN
jgi:Ca-activated chloride channel family protein